MPQGARNTKARAQVTPIPIDCPDDLTNGQSQAALADLAQQAFVVRLYQLGRVSSGRAAEILHRSRREFLDILGDYGVSPFDENIDVEAEARRGR
jgi:uncharacterized protein UPF0175